MATSTESLDWRNIDIDQLPASLRDHYETYKTAQREAARLREVFELAFSTAVPCTPGSELRFGYKFGKLSIAIAAASKPRAKTSEPLTLASLMALSGRGR